MRVIFAGGGTGGHLFPGLAVAREFQRRDAMTEILFVGTDKGIEARVLPREGFPLETITVKGLKGRGVRGLLDALYGIPAGLLQSLGIVKRFRPDCILGLGGYASGPLLLAAKLRGIRCAIMEQNLQPGFTNKVLARFVDKIFTSYRETASYLPSEKVLETGNPVRWQRLPDAPKGEKFTLLIFGGSAGAHRINMAVLDALKQMTDLASQLRIVHQTGAADFPAISKAYQALPFDAEALPFIDRMDDAYARADLVLCRAGATTVAELTAFGKAAILIPYPYAIYDHQRWNAQALADKGAAEMMLDQELNGAALAVRLRAYVADQKKIELMARAALAMGRPEAAARIVDECYALARG
jgi:UDP-N-acetylglucosamine--N-acetylmuramyl-(pentapeptide) pyrophosphoryl-undecaprenol N-acetylglucosamine transferase